jgi:hypothetical protein
MNNIVTKENNKIIVGRPKTSREELESLRNEQAGKQLSNQELLKRIEALEKVVLDNTE